MYCSCSTNNRAQTVLQLFLHAVEVYGLPERVRCDRGTEKCDVGYCMLSHPLCGPDTVAVLFQVEVKGLKGGGMTSLLGVPAYSTISSIL